MAIFFSRRLFPCLFRWPMRLLKRLQCIRAERTPKKIEAVVNDLLGEHGKVSASEVSAAVTSVGEGTVRRHLAKMVEGGQLAKGNGGRATVYRKGR